MDKSIGTQISGAILYFLIHYLVFFTQLLKHINNYG